MKLDINKLIRKSVSLNKSVTITATGDSMKPIIFSGSKITISPLSYSQVKVSDIIAYINSKGKLVIHQCLFKTNDYFVTIGINNRYIDHPQSANSYIGVITTSQINTLKSMYYQSEIEKISHKFGKPILLLKGAAWQKQNYGYFLNKFTGDTDLLVKNSDYQLLKNILNSFGYKSQYHDPDDGEISFCNPDTKLVLDIHLTAIRTSRNHIFSYPIDPKSMHKLTDIFWENSSKTKGFYYLQNEYLLLYLCLNLFFHHAVRGAFGFAYIAHIINNQKIDWKNFWNISKQFHFDNYIYYSLGWTSRLLNIPIPSLNSHRPFLFQRLLIKIFINRYTVVSPLSVSSAFGNWLNTKIITCLRLILWSQK